MTYPLGEEFDTRFLREDARVNAANSRCVSKHLGRGYRKKVPAFLPNRTYEPEYTITVPSFEQGLEFCSRFENGNLKKAIRISKVEYELHLSEDYGTSGHYHWFYFKTTSKFTEKTTVTFSIVNMIKPNSLYSVGFRPFVYSVKQKTGWVPGGEDISYTPNPSDAAQKPGKKCHILRWKYTYDTEADHVYFAQFVPYTYTDLLHHLRSLHSREVRLDVLCRTLGNNVCPLVTITEKAETFLAYQHERAIAEKPRRLRRALQKCAGRLRPKLELKKTAWNCGAESPARRNRLEREGSESQETIGRIIGRSKELEMALLRHKEDHGEKKAVVITGRVHPGEVPGSWMMKGLIDFLLSDTEEARMLRRHYVFRIIPMLNPDGVVYGNYRCNLLGYDLNRQWKRPDRVLQPTIYYAKDMLRQLREERRVQVFCDLHAHSGLRKVFMYCCSHQGTEGDADRRNAGIRVVPLLMEQLDKHFSYRSSQFQMEKCKESTARVVLFKELDIDCSYTCEASFFGYFWHRMG